LWVGSGSEHFWKEAPCLVEKKCPEFKVVSGKDFRGFTAIKPLKKMGKEKRGVGGKASPLLD